MSEGNKKNYREAPELIISKWFNANESINLSKLRGKVVAIHAFQMLCPGCVLHGIPQAKKLFDLFNDELVSVLGIHTVFEHHEGMQEKSLQAFLHEFRVKFPVGVDQPSNGSDIPQTMEIYQMRGTPTWLLIDRFGYLRFHAFGQLDDLVLGSEITKLVMEENNLVHELFKKNRSFIK